jgi:acyl carrier protein
VKDLSQYEIAEVIADEFDLFWTDVKPDDRLDSLTDGFDEFDRMNLCANLETALDIKIPSETEMKWVTVQDIYDSIGRMGRDLRVG